MSSARYVGRVGALAVALGIGAVIAGVPGVAWAGPEGEPDPSDPPGVSATENPDGSTGDVSDTDVGGGDLGDPGDTGGVGDVEGGGDSAGGMQVGSSGGVITSTNPGSAGAKSEEKDRDADPPKKRAAAKQKAFSVAPSLTKTTTHSTEITVAEPGPQVRAQAPALSIDPPKDPGPQIKPPTSLPVDVAPLMLAAPGLQKQVPARMTAVTKPLAQSPVSQLLPFVTLAPGFLAAGRQVDKKASIEDESIARTVDSTETSLMLMSAAAKIAPTASPTKRDNVKPTLSFTAPATVSGTVTLDATASDNVRVTEVLFFVDNTNTPPLGAAALSPYSASWNTITATNGPHTLIARARDAAGNITEKSVSVTVDNAAPTLSFTAPATVSGTVTLNATASDNAGGAGMGGVQFLLDDVPVGAEDTTPDPINGGYSVAWNTTTVTNDTHTVTATARDAAGNITTSTVSVTVDNSPPTTVPFTVASIPANSYPTAVAFSGDYAFVYGGDVIWTIDTRTNEITDWTAFYNEPAEVSDGTRRYEYEPGYMSVSVVDNKTNAVIRTIDIPTCDSCGYLYGGLEELAISPDGTRLYARHTYWVAEGWPLASAVTVIDTSKIDTENNELLRTTGPIFAKDIEIGADGRVYTIDEDWYYPDVVVYDKDMRNPCSIPLTSWTGSAYSFPTTLAMSTDGKHAFLHVYDVEGGGMTVSIIDTDLASPTYNAETYMTERYSAVSPDGTRLYVPELDGKTISVYDTATNAKIGSFVTDEQPNTSFRGVYFAPNGTLYVADPGDNTLYAVTIGGATAQRTENTKQTSLMLMSAAGNTAPTAEPSMGTPNQTTGTTTAARATNSPQNSLMMMAAAASAPAVPTVDVPNQATGAVSGSLNGYTVAGQPVSGKVVVGGDTYTYTPTAAARLQAALTTQPDFDSFAVTMSGQPATTVTVPILPGVLSNVSKLPAANQPVLTTPTGLAVTPTYTYVTDQKTAGTVSVINTATGAVVKTIAVGSQPSAVAINPATGLAYVTNRGSGTVSVIDTATNAVVGSAIGVGSSPQDVAVAQNDTITRIYVVNNSSNNVSVIDARNGNQVSTIGVGLGTSAPTSVAVSADGARAYVTYRASNGGGRVAVINTATNTVIATVNVGTSPQDVAVAGTNVYVANNGSSSVSVINTAANNSVTTINVGTLPTSLAVSPDGSLVAVARNNDNVAVIDTKTNTVIGAQYLLDTTSPDGGHVVAFSPDGRILVTDAADHTVRVVGLARGNTAPVSIANPTVDANLTAGVVFGLVNVKDWDGDSLRYSPATPPSKGTVTFDPAAGTYTYTPTQPARDAAALTPGDDFDTFTIRVTDDPYNAIKDVSVTVPVVPTPVANRAPQAGTPSIDTQNGATGAVSGLLNFTDLDGNPMTYSVPTQPSSGTVTLVDSRYTFTPNQAARDAAAISEGPDAVNIAVVASDGQLSTPVTFSVPILPPSPPNQAPVHGTPSVDTIVSSSGAVSGSLNFTDPEGDSMTYSVPVQPASGTVTFSGSRYTFTPTAAARAAAAASQGADLATITVVASDGLASDTVTFTVPIMQSVKATNQAPWVPGSTIPRTFDPVSGAVTGYMNVQNPDGDTLIYTLAAPPTQGGTVTFDQRSGYFTYTPSQAARAQAAQTPGLDYDTFSVNITDGTATTNTTVKVQVAPALPPTAPTTNSTVNVGTGPSGVVVLRNNNAYIVNYDSNTVSVINTATNQVVKTIGVGSGPLSVTAVDTPQRQRVYVSNSLSNTVSVIDPNTNTVIDTITVSIPPGVYENPEWGTFGYQDRIAVVVASENRLYVNATDGTLRVYDTTNDGKTLTRTDAPGVFTDLELSADGKRLYGTSAGRLLVYDTATMTPINVVVGPGAGEESDFGRRLEYTNGVGNVALSPDGKRAYVTYTVTILQSGVGGQPYGSFVTDASGKTWMVTGGYNAVSVIDTDPTSVNYNKEIARILVPQGTQDLAVSGNKLYVMNPDNKTVTIIDTATNRLVGSFTTDQSTAGRDGIWILLDDWYPMFSVPSSSRHITVGANGTVYITDYADGKMYAVTVGSPIV